MLIGKNFGKQYLTISSLDEFKTYSRERERELELYSEWRVKVA
jgi:hypothetical protein